ncbi:alpha-L-fucosidase [Parapedobacter soli]|uniref:alpha-L-fucosidase n=1 Tax=Parapedobacter soli TaxID=416955 RepID=UPI0021C5BCA9|nr:alpha-L-fucosidase [Parapedobacter soli]
MKQGRLGSPLVEVSPFVFDDRLYLLENNQRFWDLPDGKPGDNFHEDEVRIRDVASGELVSVPLTNHGFGTVLVWNNRVYIFAGNYGRGKPWRQMTSITMTSSSDLKNWTEPITVLEADPGEFIYNTAVCRANDQFVMLYETNDAQWPPFTFKYLTSSDMVEWDVVPDGIYGRDKYVGGPALYFEDGWYYTLYLQIVEGGFETRITRSQDLVNWQDAPEDRPFVTFDKSHQNIPLLDPNVRENNASDVELCYFKGQTILYFTGSDQTTAGDLQWAIYEGTPRALFEYFFEGVESKLVSDTTPPEHRGDWAPVLIAPTGQQRSGDSKAAADSDYPTPQQLELQERQLGAFIHFGPATYIYSDMMSVPEVEIFNPTQLDAEQWVKTAVSFGAKHVVLTAKHHNGFCLWPTITTDYSVKNVPWRDGQGDVVAEFVAACRKYGVKPGLYISSGDKYLGCTSTPDPMGERKLVGDIDTYFPVFFEQVRELLTNYGAIDYVWFDGAHDPFGWDVSHPETGLPLGTAYGDAIRALIRNLQPQAVVFGGTQPDVRWSGSEQGWASYPLWNVIRDGEQLQNWVGPQNTGWIPAEANIHPRSTWFWTPDSDHTLRDIPFMEEVYFQSIGRGANLLINMSPDTSGLVPPAEVEFLKKFGKHLEHTFGTPLVIKDFPQMEGDNYIELTIPKNDVRVIELVEDIKQGQRVARYSIDALVNQEWKTISEGQSIGRRRLERHDSLTTDRLRIHLVGNGTLPPVIKKIAVY